MAEGLTGSPESISTLALSQVDGGVVLSEPPLALDGDAFARIPGTEDLRVVAGSIVGHWPDDLFTLTVPRCFETSKVLGGKECPWAFEVHHYQRGSWTQLGVVPYQGDRARLPQPRAWTHGRLATVTNFDIGTDNAPHYVDMLRLFGKRPRTEPRLPRSFDDLSSFVPLRSGEVLLERGSAPDGTDRLELWELGGQTPKKLPVPATGCWSFKVFTSRDLVAFGAKHPNSIREHDSPCAQHFDGKAWTPLDLPAWGTAVLDYDREADGTEWLIMNGPQAGRAVSDWAKNPFDSRLYTRTPGSDWHREPLPPPRYAHYQEEQSISPTSVRVIGEGPGSVWVRGRYKDDCDRGVILRNAPFDKPCRLESGKDHCATEPLAPSPAPKFPVCPRGWR